MILETYTTPVRLVSVPMAETAEQAIEAALQTVDVPEMWDYAIAANSTTVRLTYKDYEAQRVEVHEALEEWQWSPYEGKIPL